MRPSCQWFRSSVIIHLIVAESSLPVKIEARITRRNGHWLWTGSAHPLGYGVLQWDGRQRYAHRVVFELLAGRIPAGRQLHHRCERRECVNPAHLEVVTGSQHSHRDGNASKTHCKHGHELTPENVYRWRGARRCRECGREAGRRAYARAKAKSSGRFDV